MRDEATADLALSKPFGMRQERRRVLFVLPSLGGGGAERAVITLLEHLDRSRFEPHLALLEKAGPYLADVPGDVPVHGLETSRVRYALRRIVRVVRTLRPGVVLATLRELNFALIVAKPFLPRGTRLLVREATSVSAFVEQDSRIPWLWRLLYRHFYPRADGIICVADHVLEDLAEQFRIPRQKLVRIYNPMDLGRVQKLAEAGGNPYAGDGPRAVAAGRLSKEKGVDLLLEAFSLVRKVLPTCRLTILGQGPLEPILRAERKRLGLAQAVEFAGFQPNPYAYFKHADVFVLPSRYDAMPNAVLEALAVGTPVVATDCPGGIREILGDSPVGALVPPADVRRLADAIISACRERRKIKPESLERVLWKFRVDRVVEAYERLLSS